MVGVNGHANRSPVSLILVLTDGISILVSFWAAAFIRFWGEETMVLEGEIFWKIPVLISAVLIMFYYAGLYDLKNFRGKMRIIFSLVESLGISFVALAIAYYSIPTLVIGRGVLTLSFIFIFFLGFFGRLLYGNMWRRFSKERIIIVGTGKLAKRIAGEIHENGREDFEIIGFVGERGNR